MKRENLVMMFIVLMMTVWACACSNCGKMESQPQKQVRANPVIEGPHDPVFRDNLHNLPLIIDPDKVDDYFKDEVEINWRCP